MARLAEVSIAPAEPLRKRAAELALKLDEFSPVRLAQRVATAYGNCGTISANELFWLILSLFFLCGEAIFHSSEVRFLALEAHVVGQLEHGPLPQVVVESVAWV